VEGEAGEELLVVGALAEGAARRLAGERERVDDQRRGRLAGLHPPAQGRGELTQLAVAGGGERRLAGDDRSERRAVGGERVQVQARAETLRLSVQAEDGAGVAGTLAPLKRSQKMIGTSPK